MFRSVLKSRSIPYLVGGTLGVAGALYAQNHFQMKLRAESLQSLDPDQWIHLPVKSNHPISHDTKLITFELPEDHRLGGDTAYCVLFRIFKDGKAVIRPYTPVSDPEQLGEASFVVKKYPGGAMGTFVHNLGIHEGLEIKGPISKYPLKANQHTSISLLGGGSGITPLYQILYKVANDPTDKTKVNLFYGSQTPDDILLKEEIDALVAKKPDQLKVTYFVDSDPKKEFEGQGTIGYITKDFLAKNLPKPSSDNIKLFVCGPPGFYKAISGNKKSPSNQGELTGALQELGYDKDQVFKF